MRRAASPVTQAAGKESAFYRMLEENGVNPDVMMHRLLSGSRHPRYKEAILGALARGGLSAVPEAEKLLVNAGVKEENSFGAIDWSNIFSILPEEPISDFPWPASLLETKTPDYGGKFKNNHFFFLGIPTFEEFKETSQLGSSNVVGIINRGETSQRIRLDSHLTSTDPLEPRWYAVFKHYGGYNHHKNKPEFETIPDHYNRMTASEYVAFSVMYHAKSLDNMPNWYIPASNKEEENFGVWAMTLANRDSDEVVYIMHWGHRIFIRTDVKPGENTWFFTPYQRIPGE